MQIDAAAELRLYWSINDQLAINVLGARVTGSVTFDEALANALATIIKGAFPAQVGDLMPPSTQLMTIGIRDLRTDNQAEFRDTQAPVAGTAVGDAMPAGDAICVTNRTALSGKSFTGRTYLSGWTEAQNGPGGTVDLTAATRAVGFVDVCRNALAGNGMAFAVLSRPSEEKITVETTNHADGTTTLRTISHVKAKTGTATVVVASESRNAFWESQRRRDNGRGAAPTSLLARVRSSGGIISTPFAPPKRARPSGD